MAVDEFERFAAAGVVEGDDGGMYEPADIARVRLVSSLIDSGVSLDEIAGAIANGRLSFGYVGQLMPNPVRLVPTPEGDHETGPLRWEELLEPIIGTERRTPEWMREDDLRLYEMMDRASEIGIPPDRVVRLVRSFAQTISRLVDMQREFVDEVLIGPAIAETGSAIAALEATSEVRYEYRRLGRATVMELMDQGMDEAIFRSVVQLTEQALERGGVGQDQSKAGVTFIDISDYSRLAEEHGDEAAAVQASRLSGLIQDVAREHGARMVKSLGDGALVHAPNANAALNVALDAVAGAADRGVWTLHAGVHAGRVVPRDGDLFGSAVNIASRLADEAGPGQVVASGAVVDVCFADGVIQVEPVGTAELKNISKPVDLFAVTRKV